MQIAPKFDLPLVSLGFAHAGLGQYLIAIDRSEDALHLNLDASAAMGGTGESLFQLGRFHEAIAMFDRARISSSDDMRGATNNYGMKSRHASNLRNLGMALKATGRKDLALSRSIEAEKSQEAAVNSSPEISRYRRLLAKHHAALMSLRGN